MHSKLIFTVLKIYLVKFFFKKLHYVIIINFYLFKLINQALLKVAVRLENQTSGEVFTRAIVDAYPGETVESVIDSSRFFFNRTVLVFNYLN